MPTNDAFAMRVHRSFKILPINARPLLCTAQRVSRGMQPLLPVLEHFPPVHRDWIKCRCSQESWDETAKPGAVFCMRNLGRRSSGWHFTKVIRRFFFFSQFPNRGISEDVRLGRTAKKKAPLPSAEGNRRRVLVLKLLRNLERRLQRGTTLGTIPATAKAGQSSL